ncbi:MAG: GNAT family N-acetyltransferase [Gemmatimonadota bacterium]
MNPSVERIETVGPATERLGRAMARAFRDEPNTAYMVPDPGRREAALAWFFGSFVVRLGLRYGEVWAETGGGGGAVWMRPGASASSWGAMRAGLLAMPLHFGLSGTRRAAALGGRVEQVRASIAPPSHWYLMALGIDPDAQGRGLAAATIRSVLARADADAAPCYLETFRETTTHWYRRFGFHVVHTDAVPDDGPRFWCMTREPREPGG